MSGDERALRGTHRASIAPVWVSGPDTVTFGEVWAGVRRRWPLVLLVTIAVGALGGLVGVGGGPASYVATNTIALLPTGVDLTQAGAVPARLLDPVVEQHLVRSDKVLEPVAAAVSPPADPDELAAATTLEPVAGTEIVSLSVTAEDPERARSLVDAVSEAYLEARRRDAEEALTARSDALGEEVERVRVELEALAVRIAAAEAEPTSAAQLAVLQSERDALVRHLTNVRAQMTGALSLNQDPGEILDRATPTLRRDGPGRRVVGAGAALLGLVLGVATALVRDRVDDRIWDVAEVERLLPAPLVVEARTDDLRLPSFADSDTYRRIRDLLTREREPAGTAVAVTAPRADPRAGTVAVGIGNALAPLCPTVVVDPTGAASVEEAARWFGAVSSDSSRLDDFLWGAGSIELLAARASVQPGLSFLRRPTGAPVTDVSGVPRLRRLLAAAEGAAPGTSAAGSSTTTSPCVVVTAPAVLEAADGAALAALADAVVLTVRLRTTSRRDLLRALQRTTTARNVLVVVTLPHRDPPDRDRTAVRTTAAGASPARVPSAGPV